MKLYNITLISLLLCSSAVFADTDKETASTTKNADTAKFFGYSALVLSNAGLSLASTYFLAEKIYSGKLHGMDFLWGSYLIPVSAYLAKSDAQNAWQCYQKAFSANNKIEPTSTSSSNETAIPTKKVNTATLLGYSGFALINLAVIAICDLGVGKAYKDGDHVALSLYLIAIQASSRLAVSSFYSMLEHYRKLFPSKDIMETSHETT